MKSNHYKHFKEGDYIVCIKEAPCLYRDIFDDKMDGIQIELYKTYIFDKYLKRQDGSIIYKGLILKGYIPLHEGKNFMLLSEFRRIKLNKLKRKLFFKKTFRTLGLVK